MKIENYPVEHAEPARQAEPAEQAEQVGQASPNRPVGEASQNQPVGQASRLSELSYRRHLPHYQQSAGYYFITFATYKRQLLSKANKDCVFNAIGHLDDKKYELYAAVVLDDHVHIVINPIDVLSKIMHSIKSFTAHEINKTENSKGKVWQGENYDRIIRDEDEFLEKINYIANNPIKASLVKNYEDYKWLFIKGWINDNSRTGGTPVLLRGKKTRPEGEVSLSYREGGKQFTDRRDACPTGIWRGKQFTDRRDACPTITSVLSILATKLLTIRLMKKGGENAFN